MKEPTITVEIAINAPLTKIWEFWTMPQHIQKWNNTSDEWHTPYAENNLKKGGKFIFKMENKNGSEAFDYTGIYDEVLSYEKIAFTLEDGRKVENIFKETNQGARIIETFEPLNNQNLEFEKAFCQGVLNNFKKYVEDLNH